MNNLTYVRIGLVSLGVALITGCRPSRPEVRSLLSFQEVWNTAKKEKPYLFEIAQKIVARTDSLRQKEVSQFLVENKINEVIALLEYESAGWNLEGIYTVIVVTKHTAYQIRFFNQGREVKHLKISATEMVEICKSVEALDRYESEWGAIVPYPCYPDIIFVTMYKHNSPVAMFFRDKPRKKIKSFSTMEKSPQSQLFCQLCEILLFAQAEDVASDKTDLKYPYK